MPFDNQGIFTRVKNWSQEVITFADHNDEDSDFALAFNNTVCRDGCSTMTGALKMGDKKVTGMANGTDAKDAINKGQLDTTQNALQANIDLKFNKADFVICRESELPVNPVEGVYYFVVG